MQHTFADIRNSLVFLILSMFLAVAGFANSDADAQTYQARFYKQVCQRNHSCQTVLEYGSAVCIGQVDDNQWIFLTVAHGVRGASATHVGLSVNGKPTWVFARVLGSTLTHHADFAVLSVNYPGQIPCYTIYEAVPPLNAEAILIGFPQNGYRKHRVRIRSKMTVSGLNQSGDSGGPVQVDGKLAGIQWGHSTQLGATFFTPIDVVKPEVVRLLGYWPKCSTEKNVAKTQPHQRDNCRAGLLPAQSPQSCESCRKNFQELREAFSRLQQDSAESRRRSSEQFSRVTRILDEQERQLNALKPLLKRRVVLEDETGNETASQTYRPQDAIRLRARYRSRSQ